MQLAQLNIARMLAPLDSDLMKDFSDNLDPINALAEDSKGFVWRYKEEDNNATSVTIFDDDYWLINMSVWESIKDLSDFVYKSGHVEFFRRRREWFELAKEMTTVMWYIEENQFPTVEEAVERLLYLRSNKESPYAFSFRKQFTPEDLNNYHKAHK